MLRNTLTANDKYPFRDLENLLSWNHLQLSFKPNIFSDFLIHFWILRQMLNILEKMMIAIGTLLRKLHSVKDLVRLLSKKHCFTTAFDSQHVKVSQTLVKSPCEHFHHVFPSL